MSERHLFVIGATHRNAPVEVRDRLALKAEAELAHFPPDADKEGQ